MELPSVKAALHKNYKLLAMVHQFYSLQAFSNDRDEAHLVLRLAGLKSLTRDSELASAKSAYATVQHVLTMFKSTGYAQPNGPR
eukprot:7077884-Pyramimonas_sp.AAC.1